MNKILILIFSSFSLFSLFSLFLLFSKSSESLESSIPVEKIDSITVVCEEWPNTTNKDGTHTFTMFFETDVYHDGWDDHGNFEYEVSCVKQ